MRLALAAVVVAVAATACGGEREIPESWVAAERDFAFWMQWDRSGEEITGTGVAIGLSCNDSRPAECVADELPFGFRGTITGERIQLWFASDGEVETTGHPPRRDGHGRRGEPGVAGTPRRAAPSATPRLAERLRSCR